LSQANERGKDGGTALRSWARGLAFTLSGYLTSMTVVDGEPVELAEPELDFMSLLLLFWAWPWGR
jgi:hypothetical protein